MFLFFFFGRIPLPPPSAYPCPSSHPRKFKRPPPPSLIRRCGGVRMRERERGIDRYQRTPSSFRKGEGDRWIPTDIFISDCQVKGSHSRFHPSKLTAILNVLVFVFLPLFQGAPALTLSSPQMAIKHLKEGATRRSRRTTQSLSLKSGKAKGSS